MGGLGSLKAFVVRHRVKILDAGFVAVIIAVGALFAFEVEIFATEGRVTARQMVMELNELLVLVTLVMCGALFYTWRRAREHQRENARRLEAEREVLTLAMHDPLTGLPNRRQFDAAVKAALHEAPTAPQAHALLVLDLNGFKKINDVHGHPAGDQVLVHVGARLLRAVREGDLVARLGGDEFAILARNLDGPEAATSIGLRIIDSIAPPIVVGGLRHTVGAAIGLALSPHDGDEAEELLRKADVALYRAKDDRGSAMRFFEPGMDARLRERDALEQALAEGLETGAFVVRFQPAARVGTDQVTAFEALPRWLHPTLGELEPDRFLPVAEEAGLLAALTERLLRQACVAAVDWPALVRLSFNLPTGLLGQPTFGLRIQAVLAETGLAPGRLDLEIDEGALIREAEAAEPFLSALRAGGVSIVADHFGTGYSDLQNLHRLRLDRIKIDPSFVAAMLHDRQAAVMVKALIGVGQGLGLSVMADGVGGEAEARALEAEGCDLVQGALYGPPLAAEDALALVRPRARARRDG